MRIIDRAVLYSAATVTAVYFISFYTFPPLWAYFFGVMQGFAWAGIVWNIILRRHL